ncbi:MAG: hypothetical protein FWG98_13340 [Candidatus Cloacimonetes bacterium]|nr:hypothetical protein [Candidatus Cloacimonadota bacterium]
MGCLMTILVVPFIIWFIIHKLTYVDKNEICTCSRCKVNEFPRYLGTDLSLIERGGGYFNICPSCFVEWENTLRPCTWCGELYKPSQWADGTNYNFLSCCSNRCANSRY